MQWSTEVNVPPGPAPIGYGSSVLLLGSCFATHMGDKLRYFQIPEVTNPFGVIFHPAPLLDLLQRARDNREFGSEDVFQGQGLWRSLWAHSALAHPDRDAALAALNDALQELRGALASATHCIFTFGTARAYRDAESGRRVANCQKLPASRFSEELSGVPALERWMGALFDVVRGFSPDGCLILSVSPVRHLRDGLVANQRSKAHLLVAGHTVCESHGAHYFPAYEILMDELRDYRFYDRDMVHPSAVAVDFVWERFSAAWMGPEALPVMKEVEAVRRSLAHRPLHPGSGAHEAFRTSLESRIAKLQSQYPHMKF